MDVKVYGVDERFWKFNGVAGVATPENRNALMSSSLASELGSGPGESLLLRLEKPSDIPVESLHGRKEDPGQIDPVERRGRAWWRVAGRVFTSATARSGTRRFCFAQLSAKRAGTGRQG